MLGALIDAPTESFLWMKCLKTVENPRKASTHFECWRRMVSWNFLLDSRASITGTNCTELYSFSTLTILAIALEMFEHFHLRFVGHLNRFWRCTRDFLTASLSQFLFSFPSGVFCGLSFAIFLDLSTPATRDGLKMFVAQWRQTCPFWIQSTFQSTGVAKPAATNLRCFHFPPRHCFAIIVRR